MKWIGLPKKVRELGTSLYLIASITVSLGVIGHILNVSNAFSILNAPYSNLDIFISERTKEFWQVLLLLPLLIPACIWLAKRVYRLLFPKLKGTNSLNRNLISRRALRILAFGLGMMILLNLGIFNSYSLRELELIVLLMTVSIVISAVQLLKAGKR